MDFNSYLNVLIRVDSLIHLQNTGTPADLAHKLNVSERTVYNIVAFLRELGGDIVYDKYRSSYCYRSSKRLFIKYE